GGGSRPRAVGQGRPPRHLAFHPDGRRLAVLPSKPYESVEILDSDTDRVVRTLSHPAAVHYPAWRGDGGLLAAACQDRRIYVWDMADPPPAARPEVGRLAAAPLRIRGEAAPLPP